MSVLDSMVFFIYYFTFCIAVVSELVRKEPQLDTDRDSAMGVSVFTGGKSTTLSEASFFVFFLSSVLTYIVKAAWWYCMCCFSLSNRILWTGDQKNWTMS